MSTVHLAGLSAVNGVLLTHRGSRPELSSNVLMHVLLTQTVFMSSGVFRDAGCMTRIDLVVGGLLSHSMKLSNAVKVSDGQKLTKQLLIV